MAGAAGTLAASRRAGDAVPALAADGAIAGWGPDISAWVGKGPQDSSGESIFRRGREDIGGLCAGDDGPQVSLYQWREWFCRRHDSLPFHFFFGAGDGWPQASLFAGEGGPAA
eukprot:1159504-Pelagomonas_calceolata.AAC.15